MSWIAAGMATVGVASSIASSISQNKQTDSTLTNTVSQINKDYTKQIGQLQEQFNSVNDDIALEMTTARYNGLRLSGSTSNVLAEKNIAGNTAAKEYYQSKLSAMFAHNALEKKAEDTWKNFGVQMDNVRNNANNAIYGAANKAQAADISMIHAGASAIQAGSTGYTMGSGLSRFLGSVPSLGSVGETGLTSGSLTESAGFGASTVNMGSGVPGIDTQISSSYFE